MKTKFHIHKIYINPIIVNSNKIKIIHKILRVDIQRISHNNGNLKKNLKWRKITLRLPTNNNENNLNLVTIYNDLYNFNNEINKLNHRKNV